ncbi:MAG: hypothetical protein E7455_09100 [Ruminococcaceae bacterium]|nr:hypothetical protein [Oscillospiraceae bacterium]
MKMNTIFKRVVSLFLGFVLIAGLLPVSVLATGYSIVVDNERPNDGRAENDIVIDDQIIASDEVTALQNAPLDAAAFLSDVHGSTTDLQNTLPGLNTSGIAYSSISFLGDTMLTMATVEGIVDGVLTNDPNILYVCAPKHDNYENDKEAGDCDIDTKWGFSGLALETEHYYVYTVYEPHMQYYNQESADAAQAFIDWANAETTDHSKPVFVISHRPMHQRRYENLGAFYWYDALTEVADQMDVFFLWGHNHYQENATLDVNAYYVAKDGTEKLIVQGPTQYENKSEVPNFTYMCAGYLNANKDVAGNSPRRLGLIVTAEIYADKIVFQDYTKDGAYTGSNNNNYYHIGVEVAREFAVKAPTLDALTISGQTEYFVGDELDLTVTAAYSDGTSVDVTKEATITGYDMSKAGTYTVTATYEGKTATIQITVEEEVFEIPEDYALNRIEVTHLGATKYFVGEALDTDSLKVVAVYTKQGEEDLKQEIPMAGEGVEDGYTVSSVDMTTTGKKYVTVSYGGKTGAFTVEVSLKSYTNEAGDVTVEFSNHGVTSATVTVTVKEVEGYNAYVTYDITPVGYTQGDEATVTVTVDTSLFDASRPVAVLDQGKVIAVANATDGKITFTTNHFSEYDVAQVDVSDLEWVEIPGESKTIFRLTDSLTANQTYVIVNRNTAGNGNAVNLNGSSINSTAVTVIADSKGNYIEAPATSAQWTYNNNKNFVSANNASSYLRGRSSTGSLRVGNSGSSYITWNYSTTYGLYGSSTNYNVNSSFSLANRSNSNRVYIYVKEQLSTPGSYVALSGTTEYNLLTGSYADQAAVEDMIRNNIAVLVSANADGSNYTDTSDYTIEGTCDPSKDGTATLTVKYQGKELGKITVNFASKTATSVVLDKIEVTVERGTKVTDAKLTVTWDDGTTSDVIVTADMLEGTFDINKNGTYTGLTVKYNGITAKFNGKDATNFILHVVNKTGPDINDFPEYPNPGSIDVDKTATGIDQNTGLTRVELSTSGLPGGKGVDVIIMLDTSSSMTKNYVKNEDGTNSSKTRDDVLEEALDALITQFKTAGPNGTPLDVRVAIADFNGYYGYSSSLTGTPYDRYQYDNMGSTGYNQTSEAQVYTGTKSLSAGAFVEAKDLQVGYSQDTGTGDQTVLNYTSGTNYDYAFDAIYQLGHAIQKENGENERKLYVIFMTDGAALQWNYYHTPNTAANWNKWITGEYTMEEVESLSNNNAHTYYYDAEHQNQPRMARAIKGSSDEQFEVIRKSTEGLTDVLKAVSGKDNMYTVPGLGATMFSINFDAQQDGSIEPEYIDTAVERIATPKTENLDYYYKVKTAAELSDAFDVIGTEIALAATNARFIDQMGTSFNLQMNSTVKTNEKDENGNSIYQTGVDTNIYITTRDIYTRDDVGETINGYLVTTDDIGKPYGTGDDMETVSFHVAEDGTVTVTSNVLSGNILKEGVICAKYFFYNTTSSAKPITLPDGSTYNLPAETFYWNIGTINEKKWTLSYLLYLDGSMDGHATEGGYQTNNFAVLYYTNHEGNEVSKSIASPTVAWKAAHVSYAFYLVDAQGNPLYADGTKAENFFLAHKVTQPVLYKSVELNNEDGAAIIAAEADDVLPAGYVLYDPAAVYTVNIRSGDQGGGANGWNITKGEEKATTYVMGYAGANDYSNALSDNQDSHDYTHTTVYFAVLWTVGTVPDTVVVDYGLDVEVSVLANDMFGKNGTLAAVSKVDADFSTDGHTDSLKTGFAATATGTYGNATINATTGKVRYSLSKDSDLTMKAPEYLAYAVKYTGSENTGFYYGKLTIIPATTIYYEDEYVDLTTLTINWKDNVTYDPENDQYGYYYEKTDDGYIWVMNPVEGKTYSVQLPPSTKEGWPTDSVTASRTQGEDRPGQFNLGAIDANNPYGYDGAYDNMSDYSMGHAAMIHVDADTYGTAEFSFWGTGFDVISMTSNDTGVLLVDIYQGDSTEPIKRMTVDTYYGYAYGLYTVTYTKNADGIWELTNIGDPATLGEGEKALEKEEIIASAENGETTASGKQYTWKPVANDPNALYQVPVINADLGDYAEYRVVLTAMYFDMLDSTSGNDGYDLYLDAIRIYNPAGKTSNEIDDTIEKVYAADGELFPEYYELRNLIIDAKSDDKFDVTGTKEVTGIVFIDGAVEPNVENYTNYGPNNELYLASGQSIAFNLGVDSLRDSEGKVIPGYVPVVRIGLKTVGGTAAVAEMWNAVAKVEADGTKTYSKSNSMSFTLNTATDMYYDISALPGTPGTPRTVVITNTGEGSILSITDIKVTYKPTEASVAGIDALNDVVAPEVSFSVTKETVELALATLPRKVIFLPIEVETVDQPIKPIKPLKPTQPGKPAVPELPELPTDPIKPIRSIHKAATAVSFEQTVVRNRRVLG